MSSTATPGLTYRRFPPPPGGEPVIESLWVVRAPAPTTPLREVLIPDGRPQVAVPLERPGLRIDAATGRSRPNDGLVSGIAVEPVVLEESGPSWYVGARLTVTAVGRLTAGSLLVDDVAPAQEVLADARLVARLRAAAGSVVTEEAGGVRSAERQDEAVARGLAEAVLARAAAVSSFAPPVPPVHQVAIDRTVAHTDGRRGLVTVAELAEVAAVDPSTLRRWFRRYVGVTPKTFASITRFYHFVGDLLGPVPPGGMATLAALQGYADASHAAGEVRRFTGVSAHEFRRRRHGIARLMHGL